MRRKAYSPTYKPDPPPKPRYKARQLPLRVFVTFRSAGGAQTQVQRGVVLVEDYLAARRWAPGDRLRPGTARGGLGAVHQPQRGPQRRASRHRPPVSGAAHTGSRGIAAGGCQPGAARRGPGCVLGGSGRAGGGRAAGRSVRRGATRCSYGRAGGGRPLAAARRDGVALTPQVWARTPSAAQHTTSSLCIDYLHRVFGRY